MTVRGIAQDILFLLVVTALVRPVGAYLAVVFAGGRTWLDPIARPVERALYRLARVDAGAEMTWVEYATAFVMFGLAGTLVLYAILRSQAPLATPLTPDLAANTAISFSTTTTWQSYAGETTMRYATQLVGLAGQNFLAGAAGLAVGIAFVRGLAGDGATTIGNFWVDVVRAILWVLLPLSVAGGIALIRLGVPMNFDAFTHVTTLEGAAQTIAQGPVAALEFIKQLGTNGGGFFNANGAHPYENPTPLANFVEMLAIVGLPAGLTYTFGRLTGHRRDGWVLYGVMVTLFAAGLATAHWAEHRATMEGKEVRFGVDGSVLTAVTTSNGATGSTNAADDSFTPLGGAVVLVNMLLGEIAFGGLGSGLYSILMVAMLGLFVTGLMVGRTPQYLGKPLGGLEVRLIVLYTLVMPLVVLPLTALAVVIPAGLAGLTTNSGPHGLTEIWFAYTSAFANNGQAFAGLNANTPFYNVTTSLAMMAGRFGLGVIALGLAGTLGRARRRTTDGALPTDTVLFGVVIISTALIVGALTYAPALALGPIVEHARMVSGLP
jgi:potassium-transporting ATPase potassium-binding subunit